LNEGPLGDSTLSDEELRALLGEPEVDSVSSSLEVVNEPIGTVPNEATRLRTGASLAARDGADQTEFRVLVASRRRHDAGMIVERLRAHSFAVDTVRNPFRALDQVRSESYDTVVSDLELWADGGGLLMERLSGLSRRPLVVFLAPRSRPRSELLRRGVAGILLCPLDPPSTELAVGQMRRALTANCFPDPPEGRASAEVSSLHGEPVVPEVGDALAVNYPETRVLDPIERNESRTDAGEVAWLRFFLEAQRLLFRGTSSDALYQSLVELGCDVLGAEGASIVYHRDERPRVYLVGATSDALDRLSDNLRDPSSARAKVGDWEIDRAVGNERCRLTFQGLPKHVWSAVVEFEGDLHRLLTLSSTGAPRLDAPSASDR